MAETTRRWIKALRSGEYQQGTCHLRIPGEPYDKYCCLGVLCEIIGFPIRLRQEVEYKIGEQWWNDLVPSSILPEVFKRGVTCNYRGISQDVMKTLIGMNDNYRSFSSIADFIEKVVSVKYGTILNEVEDDRKDT